MARSTRSVEIGELLRALVSVEGALDAGQRDRLVLLGGQVLELARRHRVSGRLTAGPMEAQDLPAVLRHGVREDRARAAASHMVATRTLHSVSAALSLPVVVKGPVLSSHWYRDAGARPYGDVDLLVSRRCFAEALDGLVASGFEQLASNWDGFRRHEVAEVPLRRDGVVIDLHWDLVGLGAFRRDVELRTDELLERAVRVDVAGSSVHTLDPLDTLLHLCVHGGLSGARRLLHLVDVDVVVRAGPLDWDAFVARAEAAQCRGLALGVLQRARGSLGTPVPPEVLAALEPFRGVRPVLRLLDDRTRDGTTGVGILVSGVRDEAARTVSATFERAVAATTAGFGGVPPAADGGKFAWEGRGLSDGEITRDRTRYLDWVAAADVEVRPTRDPERLLELFGDLEPRSSLPLAHALTARRLGGLTRAWIARHTDGEAVGALVLTRPAPTYAVAYPLLLDPAAYEPIGQLVERSSASHVAGFAADVSPLRPHVRRWAGELELLCSTVTSADIDEVGPLAPRPATPDDLADLAVLLGAVSPRAFGQRAVAMVWARRMLRTGVVVLEDADRLVGFCSVEASTRRYDVVGTIGIVPELRGRGLSWDLVWALAERARVRGHGLVAHSLPHNPMRVAPEYALHDEAWMVRLREPRRFKGEPRLWRLASRFLEAD